MIKKPAECIGCPFYSLSKYYTPDKIRSGSKVQFILQGPGQNEEEGVEIERRHYYGYGRSYDETRQVSPQPLLGATGRLFYDRLLPLSGLEKDEISLSNALRCRPHGRNELPPLTRIDVREAIRHCRTAHLRIPESVKLIVAMGSYALYQLTGQKETIDTPTKGGWRGYLLGVSTTNDTVFGVHEYYDPTRYGHTVKPVLSTLHPAALFEDKKYYHATLRDFRKIDKILTQEWPRPLPAYDTVQPSEWPRLSGFDTEYTEENKLIRWSMTDASFKTYCVEATDSYPIRVTENSTVILQNALADIPHLAQLVDISKIKIHDLMLAHSVLYTGEPHSLNYINSIFGPLNRHKHLSEAEPQLYAAMDAYTTLYSWVKGLIPLFKNDRISWQLYNERRLPLIPIIDKAQSTGLLVDQARVRFITEMIEKEMSELQAKAREITEDEKFNLGSNKMMVRELYT